MPDGQFILAHEKLFPQDVIRDPTTGAITTVINPTLNLTQAVVEGLDYEAIYILDSSSFGHGDFGRFTFTLNGTYLSRFELQISPDTKRFGISGTYVFLPTLTGSLPHTRAFPARSGTARLAPGSRDSMLARPSTTPASIKITISDLQGTFGFALAAQDTGVDHARPDRVLYV